MSYRGSIAYIMWLIVSIFYAYQYILRVIPNIMMPDIMSRFGMTPESFGQFSGIYYIGYSLMHIPVGMLLDRFGPKKILPLLIGLTFLGLLPLMYSDWWVLAIIGRLLVGIGSSGAILGVFKVIHLAFPENRFTRMLGLTLTIGLFGAIYGGGPVQLMRAEYGFETVLITLIIAGIALAVTTYFVLPNLEKQTKPHSPLKDIIDVFTNRNVIFTCLFAGLMVGPLEGFADVWGSTFLRQVYFLSEQSAASLLSMIFIGMLFGGPILSFINERLGNATAVVFLCGFVMCVCFALMLSGWPSVWLLSPILIILGIMCAYQILAIYLASTFVPEHLVGLTTASANMIIMLFGYVFHGAIGKIVHMFANNIQTVSEQNALAFQWGLAIIPAGLALSSLYFGFRTFCAAKIKS